MGEIFGVKCSKCDYSFSANIGHGMLECGFLEINNETEKPYFYGYIKDKKIITDIENILDTWDDVSEDDSTYPWRSEWFGHGSAQYLCQECGQLHNKFFFTLKGSGGKYQPTYCCSLCKKKLTFIELERNESGAITIKSNQPVKWSCPQCDNSKLMCDPNGDHIMYD